MVMHCGRYGLFVWLLCLWLIWFVADMVVADMVCCQYGTDPSDDLTNSDSALKDDG